MKPPLFILAPPRSFTTVTCAMIGNHPEMFGLAETNLFMADSVGQLDRLYRLRPRYRHGLLRSIAELGLGEQTEENIEVAKAWLDRHSNTPTSEVFVDLAAWAAPRRLIDKSPMFVYNRAALDRIAFVFPDAQFLHLTRHPQETWKSMNNLRQQIAEKQAAIGRMVGIDDDGLADRLDPHKAWLDPHLTILEFLETIPAERQMRLRGEDFLGNPKLHLARVARWLGISTRAAAIEAMLHPERSPFAHYGPRNARFGNDVNFMESPGLRPYRATLKRVRRPRKGAADSPFSDALIDCAKLLGY